MKVYWIDMVPRGAPLLKERSGPFTSRAEAERALRDVLATGQWLRGMIKPDEIPDETDGEEG